MYLVVTPDRSLAFPSVEYVRAVISKQGTKQGISVPVVVDSTHIQAADFTAAKVIQSKKSFIKHRFYKINVQYLKFNLQQSLSSIGNQEFDRRFCEEGPAPYLL